MIVEAHPALPPVEESVDRWSFGVFVLFLLPWLTLAGWLVLNAFGPEQARLPAVAWFDGYFFVYNLLLTLFSILIVPGIVFFYVRLMRSEKEHRLRRDMTPVEWHRVEAEVLPLVRRQFRLRHYLGNLLATMVVVASGVLILLLMKPAFPAQITAPDAQADVQGVDFSRGANVLLLGVAVESHDNRSLPAYYRQVAIGLTAFQFGFLGAYVYFISSLLRSYFTLDLSTHMLVAGTVRMVTSSVLALVVSFAVPGLRDTDSGGAWLLAALPVLAFFIGYFPNRGLLWIELWGSKLLSVGRSEYRQTELTELNGMSSAHEYRLQREGYDNVENLAHADALDLAVRTGFGYRQLGDWIGEARLRLAMDVDFDDFAQKTWLRTEQQVRAFYDAWSGTPNSATRHLAEACGDEMKPRIRNLALLLGCERAEDEDGESGGG